MQRGFSLVELAIVLVILGLLVGGILAGQSLIRAAELRRVATDVQQFQTAFKSFRGKHRGLPGDTAMAVDFYGARGGSAADHYTASCYASAGTNGTCNGNRNRTIDYGSGEMYIFWQHLSLAGLIEGYFTGRAGPDGPLDHDRAENTPRSTLARGAWSTYDRPNAAGDGLFFHLPAPRALVIGGEESGDSPPYAALLRPEEAWNIDGKVDDMRPGTGNVIAVRWNDCTNAPSNLNFQDAAYVLGNPELLCGLMFRNAI